MLNKKPRVKRWFWLSIVAVIFALPLSTYVISYPPEAEARQSFNRSNTFQGYYGFVKPQSPLGVIYYPGGLVNPMAYATFAEALSEQTNHSVFVIQPLFNLAITQIQAAQQIILDHAPIQTWIVGGHSLGGSSAAFFANDNLEKIAGLFFLASYTTQNADFSQTMLPILSIKGSEDRVLNLSTYTTAQIYWSQNVIEVTIIGGNHAQFGHYGRQRGDGEATLSTTDQQQQTLLIFQSWLLGLVA
jgi:predicted esterase